MKLTKFDIGAEIISIITKGMYPDPKDALREYIQNGIDAHSTDMSVKIRQESIVIEDNGKGMNREELRKAVRVGVSDKVPSKDVGFMGIGIYSSFHLCDRMTIFSRGSMDIVNKLDVDFGQMKEILEEQREQRLRKDITSEDLIDLQSLLEKCIDLTDNNDLDPSELPFIGTRVELSHIESEFYTALSNFEEVSFYLQNVIPLHFSDDFTYGKEIENRIHEICTSKGQNFELINLTLQIDSNIQKLYRPYKDSDFYSNETPQPPQFYNLENDEIFFGVSWGCLNSVRRKLSNKQLRGLILKKQGFSIGRRENLVKFFPRGNTFFDRYSGEIIIVNPKILPNASRNDIEYSPLRTMFYDTLKEVAGRYDEVAHEYQESSKANEHLISTTDDFKKLIGEYNEYEENAENLIGHIVSLKNLSEKLKSVIDRGWFREDSLEKAKDLLNQLKVFEQSIQDRITKLTEQKTKSKKKNEAKSPSKVDIAKNVDNIDVGGKKEEDKKYENLLELILDLEFEIDENLKRVIYIIDEMFVQSVAENMSEYQKSLLTIKERLEQEND